MTNFLVPVTVDVLPQISDLQGRQGMFVLPDGSININRKNGTWMIINKQSDHAGVLKPADAPIIQPGDAKWWWAGSGTYPNAGGLTIDKQGILSYDGSEWKELEVEMPGGNSFNEIIFSQIVKLDSIKIASKIVLSGNINYSYDPTGALSNAVRVDNIVCNGKTIFFSDDFTVNIQPDIDYSKPISVLFQKPLMDNLKIFVIVINISEIADDIPNMPKRYKVKSPSGNLINSWFEYFEFENHVVVANDVIFNAGIYDEGGVIYHLANFKLVSDSADNRFAYFVIPDNVWQPNTVFTAGIGGVNGSGVKVKTTSVKPTSFLAGNSGEFTLIEI